MFQCKAFLLHIQTIDEKRELQVELLVKRSTFQRLYGCTYFLTGYLNTFWSVFSPPPVKLEGTILLKISLESVERISLYYRLQTLADSEGVDRSRYNFSEDVSCMTISNFCEKQFVPNDTTLIVKKPLF